MVRVTQKIARCDEVSTTTCTTWADSNAGRRGPRLSASQDHGLVLLQRRRPALDGGRHGMRSADDHDAGRCHARDRPRRKLDATDDLARGIRQILEDPALAQRLSAAGCESVHSRTWDQRTGPFSNSFISAVHRSSVPIEPPSSAALPGDGKPRPPWRFEYRLQPLPASARSAPEEKVRKPLRDGGASRGEARSRPKFCTNSCERYYMPT